MNSTTLKVEDRPVIEFSPYIDHWKPSQQLSAGQKSTAVLPLVLMLAKGPVILDQPEDNLDTKYIASTVVPMIHGLKENRQFIFTSHNASLVIMGDIEFIAEITDQSNKSVCKTSGFLCGPHSVIRSSILEILDGGEKALRTRFKKYGLD